MAYADTEKRVAIYSKYKIVRQYDTYDKHTAVCAELLTPLGSLIVYGTIMGVYGNRHQSFLRELKSQLQDIEYLSCIDKNLCVCGDYNTSFSDNYYFTTVGRDRLRSELQANDILILTACQPECIDHIAVSKGLVKNRSIFIEEWNQDKILSDHKGIAVTLADI